MSGFALLRRATAWRLQSRRQAIKSAARTARHISRDCALLCKAPGAGRAYGAACPSPSRASRFFQLLLPKRFRLKERELSGCRQYTKNSPLSSPIAPL